MKAKYQYYFFGFLLEDMSLKCSKVCYTRMALLRIISSKCLLTKRYRNNSETSSNDNRSGQYIVVLSGVSKYITYLFRTETSM